MMLPFPVHDKRAKEILYSADDAVIHKGILYVQNGSIVRKIDVNAIENGHHTIKGDLKHVWYRDDCCFCQLDRSEGRSHVHMEIHKVYVQ